MIILLKYSCNYGFAKFYGTAPGPRSLTRRRNGARRSSWHVGTSGKVGRVTPTTRLYDQPTGALTGDCLSPDSVVIRMDSMIGSSGWWCRKHFRWFLVTSPNDARVDRRQVGLALEIVEVNLRRSPCGWHGSIFQKRSWVHYQLHLISIIYVAWPF